MPANGAVEASIRAEANASAEASIAAEASVAAVANVKVEADIMTEADVTAEADVAAENVRADQGFGCAVIVSVDGSVLRVYDARDSAPPNSPATEGKSNLSGLHRHAPGAADATLY